MKLIMIGLEAGSLLSDEAGCGAAHAAAAKIS
jgi:hypothetical protein